MKRTPKQVYASNRNFAIADCRAFRAKLRGMVAHRVLFASEAEYCRKLIDDLEKLLVARKQQPPDLAALPATQNK